MQEKTIVEPDDISQPLVHLRATDDYQEVLKVLWTVLKEDQQAIENLLDEASPLQRMDEQIVFLCNEGIKLATDPASPYFVYHLRNHWANKLMVFAQDVGRCKDDTTRKMVIGTFAHSIQTKVLDEKLRQRMIDTIYMGMLQTGKKPKEVVCTVIALLNDTRIARLHELKKIYSTLLPS